MRGDWAGPFRPPPPALTLAWMAVLLMTAAAAATGALEWIAGLVGVRRLDAEALTELGELRNRAAVAFAIAKTINAALSVAKEITVSGGVGVAGVGGSPGQILDPIDDLIEQFAVAMLVVAVAAQLMDVLLAVSAAWGLGPVIALGLFALAIAALLPLLGVERAARALFRLGRTLVVIALVLRIGVPLAVLATDAVAETFLDARFSEAQEGLGSLAQQADAVADKAREVRPEPPGEGLLNRFLEGIGGGLSDFTAALSLLRTSFEGTFHDVVTLVVVFLLETLLLPLLFLWLAWRFARALVAGARRPIL